MNAERKLTEFISDTEFTDLPQDSIDAMKNVVLNIAGTTIAGSNLEGCEAILKQVREWGGREEATILIHGGKVPAHNAAFANSYMARALDIDDAMFPGMHVGASTVTTALAIAEMIGGCTGHEFLTALVLGHETAARINSVAEYDGFDPTGISTIFGAATVAGKLLRLKSEQMLDTLGIAFDKSGGSFQSNVDGSLAVRAIQGFVAQGGIIAAQLAQRGITGPKNFIDGVYGYLHLYGKDKHDSKAVTDKLGQEFVFPSRILFKKHPSCANTETSVDAILYLVKEKGLTAEDVANIEIVTSPYGYRLVGHNFEMGQNPRVNAQFNIKYCVASALLRKKTSLHHFDEDQIRDPKITEIIKKINVKPDPALEGNLELHLRAELKVTTKAGNVYQKAFDKPRGAPGNPLTREEFQECFRDYVSYGKKPLPKDNLDKIVSMIGHLEEVKDIRSLVPLLLA
jgi:2-methylcitrate dehydratase PrpD